MERPPRFRGTIGGLMILVAALAAVLAIPHLQNANERIVAVCLFALLPLIVLADALVQGVAGRPCPACRRWSLRRLARRRSYYRCSHCRTRFKRVGFGPWQDASGPEYDAVYRMKSRARTWLSFAPPRDPGDTTTGKLLRSQRRRGRAGVGPNAGGGNPPGLARVVDRPPRGPDPP